MRLQQRKIKVAMIANSFLELFSSPHTICSSLTLMTIFNGFNSTSTSSVSADMR